MLFLTVEQKYLHGWKAKKKKKKKKGKRGGGGWANFICEFYHRCWWHGLTTPLFSNFLFTNLFSIKIFGTDLPPPFF
jgi:hypothetical protein